MITLKGGTLVKKKRFSAVLVCILTLTLLAGIAAPLASASESITFLNPIGEIEPVNNQPLAARSWTDFEGKDIALAFYQKDANREMLVALGDLLKAEYSTATTAEVPLGAAMNATAVWPARAGDLYNFVGPLSADVYDALAEYDAVILGVADEAVNAWWTVYHARQIENRGTPVVLVTTTTYTKHVNYAAQDNGIAALRSVAIDRVQYSKAYTRLSNGAFIRANVVGGVYEQVKLALTAPLTVAESAPEAITAAALGIPAWNTNQVSGTTYAHAVREFNRFARTAGFADGLPLVPPTREMVDKMLAGTTREADEIIGKMPGRGGIITIEKIAINSVMAGLDPKAFPVVIAAMEAYVNGWENDKGFYHAMTTGHGLYSIMLIVSGPLGIELGIAGDRGLGGSEQQPNNTLGRAFKLCVRNIGHTAEVDESNRWGRENDHNLYVYREQDELLPPGWKTHTEMMGFPAGSSSITLHAYWYTQEWYGGDTFGYNTGNILGHLRNGMYKDGRDKDLAVVWILPGLAWDFYNTTGFLFGSKDAMRDHMMGLGVNTGLTGFQYETGAPYGLTTMTAARINDRLLIMPIVAGGNPGYTRVYTGTGYGTTGFQTQRITGAALTTNSKETTAPAAPEITGVVFNASTTEATISWTAPQEVRGTLVRYEASCDNGVTWKDAGTGTDYKFSGLVPGERNMFAVRAVNDTLNAAEIVQDGSDYSLSHRASGRGAWDVTEASGTPATEVRIATAAGAPAAALVTVARNRTIQFELIVNSGATTGGIVWTTSNAGLATVDEFGLITTKNMVGTVTLTATEPVSGISNSIVLRIS